MSAGSLNDHSCRSRRKSPAFSFAILTSKNLSGSSLPAPQFRDQFGGWEVAADHQEQLSAIAALQHKLAGLAGPERALDLIARESVRVTEACGSAIAVLLGDAVVCRARAGSVGPPLGTSLDTQAGLAGACFRTGQVVRCDDTQTDPRVDANACRQAGIRSVLAVPLRQQYGIAVCLWCFLPGPPHSVMWKSGCCSCWLGLRKTSTLRACPARMRNSVRQRSVLSRRPRRI